MQSIKIIALCVAAAVLYGTLQDQITARLCVEYFTVGHPRIIASENPTALAFAWGFVATWWVGVLLGVPWALVARVGSRPKLDAVEFVKPTALLMLFVGLVALIGGLTGYAAAESGMVRLIDPLASQVSLGSVGPAPRRSRENLDWRDAGPTRSRAFQQGKAISEPSIADEHSTTDFWKWLNCESQAARVRALAMSYGGWYDIFLPGTIISFTAVHCRGGPGARGMCRLVIGPVEHGKFTEQTCPASALQAGYHAGQSNASLI